MWGGGVGSVEERRLRFFFEEVKRPIDRLAVDDWRLRAPHLKALYRNSFNHLWVRSGRCCTPEWSGELVRGGDRPAEEERKEEEKR